MQVTEEEAKKLFCVDYLINSEWLTSFLFCKASKCMAWCIVDTEDKIGFCGKIKNH